VQLKAVQPAGPFGPIAVQRQEEPAQEQIAVGLVVEYLRRAAEVNAGTSLEDRLSRFGQNSPDVVPVVRLDSIRRGFLDPDNIEQRVQFEEGVAAWRQEYGESLLRELAQDPVAGFVVWLSVREGFVGGEWQQAFMQRAPAQMWDSYHAYCVGLVNEVLAADPANMQAQANDVASRIVEVWTGLFKSIGWMSRPDNNSTRPFASKWRRRPARIPPWAGKLLWHSFARPPM
jgi:hypothetical protein